MIKVTRHEQKTLTMPKDANECSRSSHCYLDIGFEPCEFEPSQCDECKNVATLFFGDASYWDSREGTYLCANCLDKRREANAVYDAMIEAMIYKEST